MSFKKKVVHTLFTRGFLQVFSLINSIISARLLGPGGYGAAIMLMVFPPIIIKFVNLGVAGSLTYFVNQDPDNKACYIGTALSFSFIVAITSTTILLMLYKPLMELYYMQTSYNSLFIIVILFTPVYTLQLYLRSIMKSLNMIEELNYVVSILPTILGFVLITLLIGVFKKGVEFYIYINLILVSVVVLVMAIILIRRSSLHINFSYCRLKKMLSFGLRGFFANFSSTINEKMDKLIVGLFLSPEQIGIYSIAINIASKLKIIPNSVGLPLYPQIAKLEIEKSIMFVQKLISKLFLCLLPLVLIVISISPVAIHYLYGDVYSTAYIPLIFLSFETFFFSSNKVLGYFYVGTGRPGIRSFQKIILTVLNCIFMLNLVPIFGILGCGISILLSSIIVSVGFYLHFRKYCISKTRYLLLQELKEIKDFLLKNLIKIKNYYE